MSPIKVSSLARGNLKSIDRLINTCASVVTRADSIFTTYTMLGEVK